MTTPHQPWLTVIANGKQHLGKDRLDIPSQADPTNFYSSLFKAWFPGQNTAQMSDPNVVKTYPAVIDAYMTNSELAKFSDAQFIKMQEDADSRMVESSKNSTSMLDELEEFYGFQHAEFIP